MNQPALKTALALISLAAIALPAWAVLNYRAHPDIAALQRLADASCTCARAAADVDAKNACWQEFEQRSHADRNQPSFTACYPLSEQAVEMNGQQVTIGYHIVGGKGLQLCSKAEAIAGEAIWYRIASEGRSGKERQIAGTRADAALQQFARDLAKGRRLGPAVAAMGCVTGYPGASR